MVDSGQHIATLQRVPAHEYGDIPTERIFSVAA